MGIMGTKKTDKQIEQEANDRLMQTVAWRAGYYRANPQRFVTDYLKITLRWFQTIILWAMFHMNYVMYLAARGQGGRQRFNSRVTRNIQS